METIKGCKKCGKPFMIPPGGDARRQYCPECRHIRAVESGKRATDIQWGQWRISRLKAKRPLVVIDGVIVGRRKRPDMVLEAPDA